MNELSLHIMDIAQNSVNAGASRIEITVNENYITDILSITVFDNGKGMIEEEVNKVSDPFYTTGNKKTGLGIPLLKQQAEAASGNIKISTSKGKGTEICSSFRLSHVDRQPLGDVAGTITGLIRLHPEINWIYTHVTDNRQYTLDTNEIKATLVDIPINNGEVISFLRAMLDENINSISKKNDSKLPDIK